MRPINVETLRGYGVGISDSYYRPAEHELLEDYLKAVDYLTINFESRLRLEMDELKRNHQQESLQKAPLQHSPTS
jgi:hypothetical protein